ncbi:MAG: DUF6159 family protein [Phycisphaerales bacterium]
MFTRIRNGWALGMASLELLMENKKLVVFPLLSSIAALIVVASFVVPIGGTTTGRQIFMSEDPNAGAGPLLVLFLLYFCCYFVMLFFNAALVGVTMMHLDGRPYKLTDGLRIAWDRFSLILMWAVLASSVGFAIKMIEQRSQLAGKIVALLLGSAWTAMTYFVVPVLIVERAPAHKAIGRSFSLVKQTWGEGLVANWANSIVVGIGMIPGVLVVVAATSTGDPVIGGLGFLVGFAWIGLMVLVSMTLDAITNAVLYVYARTGQSPDGFDDELLQMAFAGKGGDAGLRIGNEGGPDADVADAKVEAASPGFGGMPAVPAPSAGPSLADMRKRAAS